MFVGVPGTQVMPHHIDVGVKVSGHEISDRDIRNALAPARGVAHHGRDELIHVIPGAFTVDGQKGIADPRGMKGQSLNAHINAMTVTTSVTRNVAQVAAQNRVEIDGFCASPYAAGLGCLVDDEKDMGCTVIDMGGGTTGIAVFSGGKLVYATAIPVGGNHVTNDIARGLTTSLADAERIKTLYGSAHSTNVRHGSDDRRAARRRGRTFAAELRREIGAYRHHPSPRIEETFELVRARLVDSGISARAGRRVVLTGGASQLPGLADIGQLILEKQIRLGRPQKIRGLAEATGGPAFSTAAGLLHYAAEHAAEIPILGRVGQFSLPGPFKTVWMQKVTHWLKENW